MIASVSAYVMVKLEAGKDEDVFTEVEKLTQIREASATYGAYDLLIKVKFENIEQLDEFIFGVLRRIPGVIETVTIIAAKQII